MVRNPRIYDVNLKPVGELRTAQIKDLKIKQVPFSTVTVMVAVEDIGELGFRQFIELFDAAGRIDIFRISGIPGKRFAPGGTVKLSCDHALSTLQDGLVPGYHQFGGVTQSLRQSIEAVLAYQDTPHWMLDRCDYDTHFEYGICDESPFTAITMLIEPLEDAMIVTDTSTYPWRLSVIHASDEDASELRYSRNMDAVTETVQDTDFATRLYPRGYGEGVNQLNICEVNGGLAYIEAPKAVRELWGTVSKPFIDTTITDPATLKAKAETALAICQTPHISYEVSAYDLSKITGDPSDRFYAGRMVRVIYKDYGLIVRTRVTELVYPDPIARPGDVKLTLCSQPTSVATIIAELARKTKIRDTYGQGNTFIFADSIEQNADANTPAEGDIYIPGNMIHVNAVKLKVKMMAYRADSKGAASGGGTNQTTAAGGESTQTSSAGGGSTRTSSAGGAEIVTLDQKALTVDILTSAPRSLAGGGTMTETGTGGPTSTESAGGGDTGDSSLLTTGGSSTAVVTGESGEHSHKGPSHTHSFSGSDSVGDHGHYHKISNPGSSSVTMGISRTITHSVSISGSTGSAGSGSTGSAGAHRHTMGSHTHDISHTHKQSAHKHSVDQHSHGMSHNHSVYGSVTVPGQTINIKSHSHSLDIPDHTHTVDIPAHTHDLTLDDHTHKIQYGIYKGPRASEFVVKIDGVAVPSDAFDERGEGDIAPYLAKDENGRIRRSHFHSLAVYPVASQKNPQGLSRIRCSWNAQVFISSLTGVQY